MKGNNIMRINTSETELAAQLEEAKEDIYMLQKLCNDRTSEVKRLERYVIQLIHERAQ
jgi:hypothetical protein